MNVGSQSAMLRHFMVRAAAFIAVLSVVAEAQGVPISLSQVMGPTGTNWNQYDADFPGQAVNRRSWFGVGGATNTAVNPGGTRIHPFDPNAYPGGPRLGGDNYVLDVRVDQKHDGTPLILDLNNNGTYADDSPQPGFGMHGNQFITFYLGRIRSDAGLPANQDFHLSGAVGEAYFPWEAVRTSFLILEDGAPLLVYDTSVATYTHTVSYDYYIPGDAEYLTFATLAGTDQDWGASHGGFVNVLLTPVPEPGSVILTALGATLLGCAAWRRKLSMAGPPRAKE